MHATLPTAYVSVNCRNCGQARYFTPSEYWTMRPQDIDYCSRVCVDAYEQMLVAEIMTTTEALAVINAA